MKNLTTFRDAGSLFAGLLVGVSIVVPVFAMTIADHGDRQTVWLIVASIVLALGLIFQAAVTRSRTDDRRLAVSRLATTALSGQEASARSAHLTSTILASSRSDGR
jgi:hypothetical protein